jgi:hypothetical protein
MIQSPAKLDRKLVSKAQQELQTIISHLHLSSIILLRHVLLALQVQGWTTASVRHRRKWRNTSRNWILYCRHEHTFLLVTEFSKIVYLRSVFHGTTKFRKKRTSLTAVKLTCAMSWVGIAQMTWQLATNWTAEELGSHSRQRKQIYFFSTASGWLWGPPSLRHRG